MIIVHHLENSRSQRILWLLEELEMPYRVRRYAREPRTMLAPAELKAVHPLGKSPVIEDEGRVIAESGAIVEYLVEKSGDKLGPPANRDSVLLYRQFLHYAEGSMMPPLLMQLVFSRLPKNPMPFFARPIVRALADKVRRNYLGPQIRLHLDYVESELGRGSTFSFALPVAPSPALSGGTPAEAPDVRR